MSEQGNQGAALTFREQVHQMLRESILDAAWQRATHTDWEAVRLADVARDVGVSRQTIYNEFGTKQQLAEAMFDREMRVFLEGVVAVTRAAPDLETALRNSVEWLFSQARTHEMLQRMLEDARHGRSTALLPLLTTNLHLIVRPMRKVVADLYDERWPVPGRDTERIADLVLRLSVSHVVGQSDFPSESVVDDIAHAALGMVALHVDS